jgi:hypothetical protein
MLLSNATIWEFRINCYTHWERLCYRYIINGETGFTSPPLKIYPSCFHFFFNIDILELGIPPKKDLVFTIISSSEHPTVSVLTTDKIIPTSSTNVFIRTRRHRDSGYEVEGKGWWGNSCRHHYSTLYFSPQVMLRISVDIISCGAIDKIDHYFNFSVVELSAYILCTYMYVFMHATATCH